MWLQRKISLQARPSGFHLVSDEVIQALPELHNLRTWQGIYLCEHRTHGGPRQLVLTLQGETG